MTRRLFAAAAAMSMLLGLAAQAEDKVIKLGVVSSFSGQSAEAGRLLTRGMELYMKHHELPGYKIEIIQRDDTGPAPEVARRLTQELIAKDRVDLLAGFQFSNNAFAVADIINRAKVPTIVLNAATSSITETSPYFVRVARTMWQSSYPLGQYAAEKLNIKNAVVAYSNYAPGLDAKKAFEMGFTKAGGQVIDDVPLPFPQIPDFTPFLQRIKDAKPDAVFVFVPSGVYATSFMKTFSDLGLKDSGIKLLGPGDLTPPQELHLMGDGVEGAITMLHYALELDNPENMAFLEAHQAEYGDVPVDHVTVQGWDGMAAIYHVIQTTNGEITGENAVEALKGWSANSPRGVVMVDAETRDVVHDQYIRITERNAEGKLVHRIIDRIPMVKDPWKELGLKQ